LAPSSVKKSPVIVNGTVTFADTPPDLGTTACPSNWSENPAGSTIDPAWYGVPWNEPTPEIASPVRSPPTLIVDPGKHGGQEDKGSTRPSLARTSPANEKLGTPVNDVGLAELGPHAAAEMVPAVIAIGSAVAVATVARHTAATNVTPTRRRVSSCRRAILCGRVRCCIAVLLNRSGVL